MCARERIRRKAAKRIRLSVRASLPVSKALRCYSHRRRPVIIDMCTTSVYVYTHECALLLRRTETRPEGCVNDGLMNISVGRKRDWTMHVYTYNNNNNISSYTVLTERTVVGNNLFRENCMYSALFSRRALIRVHTYLMHAAETTDVLARLRSCPSRSIVVNTEELKKKKKVKN